MSPVRGDISPRSKTEMRRQGSAAPQFCLPRPGICLRFSFNQMPNEADTCGNSVPGLQAAGWDNEPHSIAEQRMFTDRRPVVLGNQTKRRNSNQPAICFGMPAVSEWYTAVKMWIFCADRLINSSYGHYITI